MKKLAHLVHGAYLKIVMVAIVCGLVAYGTVFTLSHSTATALTKIACQQNVTCVALKSDHAEPDVITIPVGGYAQINSADGQTHDIASGSGDEHRDGEHVHTEGTDSGNIQADEAWKVQFNQTGTFDFHDHYHPEIHFTIIVYKPGGDYKIK